jgi:predicted SAM-dependent methyltransferase
MKVRKHSWILMPLAIVLGILLGRSGYLYPLAVAIHQINDRGTIRDYMKSQTVRKLQIGAGGNDPVGWLNSDIAPSPEEIYLDATRPYPFPDGSFQYVFSEHVIEHVSWEGGVAMLRECHRVLAPGGKVRTVTPNLRKFMQLVEDSTRPGDQEFIAAKLRIHRWPVTPVPAVYILNAEARDWGHQFLYDPATLRKSLELAGFQQINEYPVEQITDPVFREAERRARDPGSDLWVVGKWEAMAIEATR